MSEKKWFELLAAQSTLGEQQWDSLVSVGFQIKIGRPKFYAGETISDNTGLGVRNTSIGAWPSFLA